MGKELITSLKSKFDNMAHFDAENNIEFWYARELQTAFAQTYFALQTRKQELIEERLENIRRMVERRLKAEDKKISKDVFKS